MNILDSQVWSLFSMLEARFAGVHNPNIVEISPERALRREITCRYQFHKIILVFVSSSPISYEYIKGEEEGK
jgi:hypothetical protein